MKTIRFKYPKEDGRLALVYSCGTDMNRMESGWRVFTFGIVKRIAQHQEGSYPRMGKHYKGFIISFRFWFPIERI